MCKADTKTYVLSLGVSSLIGTRPDQQDSVYGETQGNSAFALICDGMGGLEGGALASQTAMMRFAQDYEDRNKELSIPLFMRLEAVAMDQAIYKLKNDEERPLKAGSTVVAVVIEENRLYWLSVGDSRIYIIRNKEIMAANRDHNYRMRLDYALKQGDISRELYEQEEDKAEALISYLGMGNVSLMDINMQPFILEDNDMVVLCSDGLYRSLSNKDIIDICYSSEKDVQQIAELLTETAVIASLESQDNTSVAVIRIQVKDKD